MNKCPSGKRTYLTHELAEEALISAWLTYHYRSGSGPVSIYQCDDCGYYHFSSQGPMNLKLAEMLKTGKVDKAREAGSWEKRLKKK